MVTATSFDAQISKLPSSALHNDGGGEHRPAAHVYTAHAHALTRAGQTDAQKDAMKTARSHSVTSHPADDVIRSTFTRFVVTLDGFTFTFDVASFTSTWRRLDVSVLRAVRVVVAAQSLLAVDVQLRPAVQLLNTNKNACQCCQAPPQVCERRISCIRCSPDDNQVERKEEYWILRNTHTHTHTHTHTLD